MKLKFKKGNTVKVISGDDRGKSGEIIEIFKDRYRATVKGLNMVKKHTKPTKEKKGGIVSVEQSIHLSNLLVEVADKKKLGKKEETKASVKPKAKEKSSVKKVKKDSKKKDIKKNIKPIKKNSEKKDTKKTSKTTKKKGK
jgi:large subunit ribosomal protein L24|tara:strand:- start:1838 stop:2257 length:420 start_codon:yes stop_codon:yes gene_type:complete